MKASNRDSWIIGIASLIPGLGLISLGRNKQGVSILFIAGFFFVFFFLLPTMVTWFVFGGIFMAQLAYAVALATKVSGNNRTSPNANLSQKIPSRFSNKRQMAEQVKLVLSSVLESNELLRTAVIGLNMETMRHTFIGVTDEHLIVAECNRGGSPYNLNRIQKEEVHWVNLQIGERNSLFKIEYQKKPEISLHVPGTLRSEVKYFMEEFPGQWADIDFNEALRSVTTDEYRREALIVYGGCIFLGSVSLFLLDGLNWANSLVLALCFFVAGWPQFISFVRRLKKETGITLANMLSSFSTITTLILWFLSLSVSGPIAIAIVKTLHFVA